jgi:hypothetical protein
MVTRYFLETYRQALAREVFEGTDPRANFLRAEHAQYETLARFGVPVVRVLGEGLVDGQPADVVERFSFSDREPRFSVEAPAILATPTARADLLRMRDAIKAGVAVADFQFLLKPGHIVVNDPLQVFVRDRDPHNYGLTAPGNLRRIDELLRMGEAHAAPTN